MTAYKFTKDVIFESNRLSPGNRVVYRYSKMSKLTLALLEEKIELEAKDLGVDYDMIQVHGSDHIEIVVILGYD